jgi:mono/diheme cytochrome c family protein
MRKLLTTFSLIALAANAALAADAKAGKDVYDKSCKTCHGADGTHNAGMGKMLKVEMRDLQSADVQAASDADMKKDITDGKGKMKPMPAITGASLDNVVAYVRTLKK